MLLQEREAGARITRTDPGKPKQHQPHQRDQERQTEINVIECEAL